MRINVYSQELTSEVLTIQKESNTGLVYSAVQLILHSSEKLHHPPADDEGYRVCLLCAGEGSFDPIARIRQLVDVEIKNEGIFWEQRGKIEHELEPEIEHLQSQLTAALKEIDRLQVYIKSIHQDLNRSGEILGNAKETCIRSGALGANQ